MSVISYLPANPNSPKLFDVEKKRLTQILSPYLELNSIEHFGSTSIEGLAGKGVIDIMIVLDNFKQVNKIIATLVESELIYNHNAGSENRRFLSDKPLSSPDVSFHYHIVPVNTPEHLEPLYFKNALLNSKELVDKYHKLKRDLIKNSTTPHEYRDGKTKFIKDSIAKYKEKQLNKAPYSKNCAIEHRSEQ